MTQLVTLDQLAAVIRTRAEETGGYGLIWAQAVTGERSWQKAPGGGVIGKAGTMPWHLPEDLRWFQKVTGDSTVIMGSRTWLSLPPRFRPLPKRDNIVLSRTIAAADFSDPQSLENTGVNTARDAEFQGARVVNDLAAALKTAKHSAKWVIGGGKIYSAALANADFVVITQINKQVAAADTFAPQLDSRWRLSASVAPEISETGLEYAFTLWERK